MTLAYGDQPGVDGSPDDDHGEPAGPLTGGSRLLRAGVLGSASMLLATVAHLMGGERCRSAPVEAHRTTPRLTNLEDRMTPPTRTTPPTLTTRSARRPVRRPALVSAVAAGLTLISALPAAAHVRVTGDSTAAGSYSALTFRVPNESDTASTTKLSVQLPQDTPFASVRTRALPGWRAVLVTAPLPDPVEVNGATLTKAVRTVTWTAGRGAAIAPGQYQDFALSVGPLPAGGEVLLPTTQTYSDGEVVRWDEPTPADGSEPEHPAPTLPVVAATTNGDAPPGSAAASVPSGDTVGRWLGGAALALAAVGAGLAALALRTARAGRSALTGRPT